MQTLCQSLSALSVSGTKAPRPFRQASSLSSKTNGIAACRVISMPTVKSVAQATSLGGLEILCADGRRGGKLKTRKSAAKRYRVTGSGRVVVRHAGKNHFQEKKSSSRRQKLSGMHLASDTHLNLIRGCLPYAKVSK